MHSHIPKNSPRERYLPVSFEMIQAWLEPQGGATLRACIRMFGAIYRYELQLLLQCVRQLYHPVNPDADTAASLPPDSAGATPELLRTIEQLLNAANFTPLPESQLNAALSARSPDGVEVQVDFAEFAHFALYWRGADTRPLSRREWRAGFRRVTRQIPIYRRLVLVLQPRSRGTEAGPLLIKLFKDIPLSDLETLFPNTTIRMSSPDKIFLGITGGGGTAGGVAATLSKLTAAANPLTLAGAVVGLAALLWRQVARVLNARTRYMARLSRNLYFCNLDNNLGAITYLAEMAAMEECKEAVLAYWYLTQRPGIDAPTLDRGVEQALRDQFGIDVDYEVADGLRKLADLELLQVHAERLAVLDPAETLLRLRRRWEELPG